MSRKLEITAISAEELTDGNKKPVKKNAYVDFLIDGNYRKSSMTTNLDEVGGDYPTWKETLEAEILPVSEKMYVKVFCRNSGKDKLVGTARVPVKDFTGEYGPEGFLHCLSYRLWDEYGKRNGIVNFSVRIVPEKLFSGEGPIWLR